MKLHYHIPGTIILLLIAVFLILADGAPAQQLYPYEGPFTPVIASPMYAGRWYAQAGVRLRVLRRFRLSRLEHQIGFEDPGVPPFGPNQDGPFGTGTGIPGFPLSPTYGATDPPNISGLWEYNNGYIDAADPNVCVADVCWGKPALCNNSTNETGPLGHFPSGNSDPSCTNGANIGSFVLFDAQDQTNSKQVNTTTRVTFSRIIDGTYDATNNIATPPGSGEVASRIIFGEFGQWEDWDKSPTWWAPSIELGLQVMDYFDLYWGFSWIYASRSINKSEIVPAELRRRGFTDTYNFFGTAAVAWPGSFFSTATIVGQEQNNYDIWPDGFAGGTFPTRTFFTSSAGPNAGPLVEHIFHQSDFSMFESRFGCRSWFPLYGMGRFGINLGFTLSPYIMYLTSSRQDTLPEGAFDFSTNPPTQVFPPGFVVDARSFNGWEWGCNFGGFIGSDLEFRLWSCGFLKTGVEFNFCKDENRTVLGVETLANPGGFGLTLAGGFHF